MKKSFKQTLLVLLALALVFTACLTLLSCDGEGERSATTAMQVPGIGSGGTTADPLYPPENGGTSGTTAAGGTSTTPIVPPQSSGDYINPLTGLRTQYDASGLRPIAVVVDNISAAYSHQTGLTQADVMYETLASPGISRLTLLISDYSSLSAICNIRNATLEHLDIVGSHNAMLVAHGGSKYNNFTSVAEARLGGGWDESLGKDTFGYINTSFDIAFTAEGGAKYGTIKYYSKTRAEFISSTLKNGLLALYYTDGIARSDLGGENGYDTILTSEGLLAVLSSKNSAFNRAGGKKEGETKGFKFVDESGYKIMNGAAASNISLLFTVDNSKGASKKSVSYSYDAASGTYLRSQDGKAHKDSATGAQLAFTNVITLFTDVTSVSTKEEGVVATTAMTGEGTGYYFYGGEAIEIKWSKSAWDAELTLTDMNGNALTLARGTTYIGYLDNTDTAEAVSFS